MFQKYYLVLLLFCFGATNDSLAQEQRFKAGVILGFNGSQINGDNFAGFNKFGVTGGIRGVVIINDRIEISTEMLYSQRGSRPELVKGSNTLFPFKINVDFIEVPVLFNIQDWLSADEEYYKLHFHAGLSYGRLISTNIEDSSPNSPLIELGDLFNKDDVSWILGATFYTNKHLAITGRYTRSFGLLYRNDPASQINARSLQVYFFTFHALYMF